MNRFFPVCVAFLATLFLSVVAFSLLAEAAQPSADGRNVAPNPAQIQGNEPEAERFGSARLSFAQTKAIEDDIRSKFLNSEEVHFTFYISGSGRVNRTVVIKDKSLLKEFAEAFRFNSQIEFTRHRTGAVPGLAVSVAIRFPEHENFTILASEPNLNGKILFSRDASNTEWCSVDLSTETVLFYNQYFSSLLSMWYGADRRFRPLDFYKNSGYSARSLLADFAKRVGVHPITPDLIPEGFAVPEPVKPDQDEDEKEEWLGIVPVSERERF